MREGGWVLGAATVVGVAIGLIYAARVTPVYRATATLEVQDLNESFLNLKEVAASAAPPVVNDLQTQVRLLQSTSLIARVIKRVGPPPGAGVANSDENTQVEVAAKGLQVRESRQSRIIDLAYESADPAYAAAFLNRLGEKFIDRSIDARLDTSSATNEWMGHQLEELRAKLAASERRLQSYANESGLLVTSQEGRPDEERLRQVQAELSKAQENRMAKQARWEMVAAAAPESLDSPLGHSLREHQVKLADLRRQRADLLAVYTSDFASVKRLEAQIADLERTVRQDQTSIRESLKTDYADAKRREELLQTSYEAQVRLVAGKATTAIQYGILKNEVDSNREVYNKMLHRSAEARFASGLRASTARFVDRAYAPRRPVRPNRLLSVLSGGAAGMLVGLLVISARGRVRPDSRPYADVAATGPLLEAAPGGPADGRRLGAVPGGAVMVPQLAALAGVPTLLEEDYRAILTSILLTPRAGSAPKVVAVTSASSGEGKSDLIHQLAATLSQMKRRVLLVDTTINGELGRLLPASSSTGEARKAEGPSQGQEVDASQRPQWGKRRRVTERRPAAPDQAMAPVPGLPPGTNRTRLDGVDLLRLGPREDATLDVAHLSNLLRERREEYDVLLIDTPALLDQPDTRALAKMSDGVVLVVRSGVTSPEEVNAAVRRLQWDGSVVLGTVVNRGDETLGRS